MTETVNFADQVYQVQQRLGNRVVVGIDPDVNKFPKKYGLADDPRAVQDFCYDVLDAIEGVAGVIKPNSAFFELHGHRGMAVLENVIYRAHQKDMLVIGDAKRGDIGNTSRNYAHGILDEEEGIGADAVTLSPYLGGDSLEPFFERAPEKGMFVLCKTSNPGSGMLQDRPLSLSFDADSDVFTLFSQARERLLAKDVPAEDIEKVLGKNGNAPVYGLMAYHIHNWGQKHVGEHGYSPIGAVIGATYPAQLQVLREVMPQTILLIPGYGKQGGGADDVVHGFDGDGFGALVNSSRGVIFPWTDKEWKGPGEENYKDAIRVAAEMARDDINDGLKNKGVQL